MKRLLVALACAWLAWAGFVQPAGAGTPAQTAVVLSGQRIVYPGASVALDFVGQACAGQPRCFKAGGVTTTNFTSLPGVVVTRASGGYAEDQTGALTWFNSGQPRITNKGLLVEEARTNLVLQSQNLGTTWQVSGATIVSTAAGAAPDGTNTASQLRSSAAGDSYLFQSMTKAASALTYTFSIYAKYVDTPWGAVQASNGANGYLYWFNVQTCTAGSANGFGSAPFTSTSYSAVPAANGWCRLIITFTSDAGTFFTPVYRLTSANGVATVAASGANVLLWGADVEQASFATSYIPTTTAAATRAGDQISLPSSGPYGTLLTDFTLSSTSNFFVVSQGLDGNNYKAVRYNGSAFGIPQRKSGQAAADIGINANLVLGSEMRVAARITSGDQATASLPALVTATDTANDLTPSSIWIGSSINGAASGAGYIKSVVVYPTGLSNAQLLNYVSPIDSSSLNFNFTAGSYRLTAGGPSTTCFTCLSGVSVTRASSGYAETAAGQLVLFGSNVPRITDKGFLVEEARTNKSTNTNVNPATLAGVSKVGDAAAVLAISDDSVALSAIGLSGNAFKIDCTACSSTATVSFGGVTGNTNPHAVSLYARGSGYTLGLTSAGNASFGPSATYVRQSVVGVPSSTSAGAFFTVSPGAVVYFILNQLEEGSFATSPIPVAGASATRAADSVIVSGLTFTAPYSAGVQASYPSLDGVNLRIASITDGTTANRTNFQRDNGNSASVTMVSGGVSQTSAGGVLRSGAQTTRWAAAFPGSTYNAAVDGASFTSTAVTLLSANQLWIGGDPSGLKANSYIQQLRIYPYAANDNELQFRSAGNW